MPSFVRIAVTTGKWFTPVTSRSRSAKRVSRSCESANRVPVTSWQRPTVLMSVSRVTARQSVVIGLVRLQSQASGHTSAMSRAMPTSTGMLRSARVTPPGPTLSPTGWRKPYRSGISMSWRMLSKPPVEMFTTTKSASVIASRWSVVARTDMGMPRVAAMCSTSSTIRGSGAGSMSHSTISDASSDGVLAMSITSLGAHW